MKKIFLYVLIWLSAIHSVEAQIPINIDSLRRVMAHLDREQASSANDTSRFRTLIELGAYHTMHTDSGLYFLNKTLKLAQKISKPHWLPVAMDEWLCPIDREAVDVT